MEVFGITYQLYLTVIISKSCCDSVRVSDAESSESQMFEGMKCVYHLISDTK